MNDFDFFYWFTDTEIFGVSMVNLAIALAVAFVVYVALTVALRLVLKRIEALAGRTTTHFDDVFVEVLRGTNHFLIALVALLVGIGMLDLPERWASRVSQLWFVALALQLALWANRAITVFLKRHNARHGTPNAPAVSAAATLMSWGVRTLLWAIVLLAMLSNMGVNITAFIASLGVGGIAVALAAQSLLGDLFASVAIAVDKPFEVGDFIVFGSVAGTVEVVGVKTTRIRSLGGEQIVMSNTELLKQTVSNYKRLHERRIVFSFRLSYATPADRAEEVSSIVKRVVEASDRVRFDRAHLKGFGESALEYEVVYIVLAPDYGVYMDEQQRINVALMREFESNGVEFAFPTRTVILQGRDDGLLRVAVSSPDEAQESPAA